MSKISRIRNPVHTANVYELDEMLATWEKPAAVQQRTKNPFEISMNKQSEEDNSHLIKSVYL